MASRTTITSPTSSYAFSSPPSSSSPTATTRRRARVTAEHTLSRVRENQRRHRARRKDYIVSLERKLAETEAQLAEAHAEIAMLRREREKKGSVVEEERLEAGVHNEMLALERLVDSLPTPVVGDGAFIMDTPSHSLLQAVPSILTDSTEALQTVLTTGPPPCCEDPEPAPPTRTTSPECSSCHTRPAPAPTESTTLCAQAYVLIAQQNFRGIDAGTIRLWLYQGYRRAQREGEGCRVENGALFRLLDYISEV